MTKPTLLIVEDDEDIRTQMKWALASDYEVAMAEDRAGAVAAFTANRPSVTLLDLGLPPRPNEPEEGLATLSSLLALDPLAKVIIVSGQGDKQNALRAVGAGAYDFLCKPVDMDELKLVLQRCVYVAELEQEYRAMQQGQRAEVFEDMLGASPPMQAVFTFIRKVAPTSAPVLILGESGTGKEMVAQALHRRSPQRNGPFIAINCNAIPENLLESELFGHEKGSFTGAHAQRKGHIESAAGGTLFLDEIGELPRVGAGEAAALSPGKALSAGRRPAGDSERHARDCGHEREPAGVGRERDVSRGPLLSAGRGRRQGALRCGSAETTSRWWRRNSCTATASQHGKARLTFRARCAACPRSSRLARQRPRAAESGAAGGHHGRGQTRHRQ